MRLSEALRRRPHRPGFRKMETEFSAEEWAAFGITGLRLDHSAGTTSSSRATRTLNLMGMGTPKPFSDRTADVKFGF